MKLLDFRVLELLSVLESAITFDVEHVELFEHCLESNHSFEFEISDFIICRVVVRMMWVTLEHFYEIEEQFFLFELAVLILEHLLELNECVFIGGALECVPNFFPDFYRLIIFHF